MSMHPIKSRNESIGAVHPVKDVAKQWGQSIDRQN